MPRFAFIYLGGRRPEDGPAHMQKWLAWSAGLGKAMVEPGMPFSNVVTVAATGVTEGNEGPPMAGVSLVEAENLDAARQMAATCPHLDLDGQIVVAEGMDMQM
jgi:hypothetical protein